MAEYVVIYDSAVGNWLIKQAGATHIADLAIVSGKLGVGAVISGAIASGAIGTPHIAQQAITSALVAANILATPHFQNQGILSASIAAGVIGHTLLTDYGIISGKVASGAITEAALASGISIDISETVQEPTFRAATSGILALEAVVFSLSGAFDWARGAQSGRQPAFGLLAAAVNSGALGTVLVAGRVANTGWNFSGYIGQPLYLGTSSIIVTTPPSASGNVVQRMGAAVSQVSMFLMPSPLTFQIGQ